MMRSVNRRTASSSSSEVLLFPGRSICLFISSAYLSQSVLLLMIRWILFELSEIHVTGVILASGQKISHADLRSLHRWWQPPYIGRNLRS